MDIKMQRTHKQICIKNCKHLKCNATSNATEKDTRVCGIKVDECGIPTTFNSCCELNLKACMTSQKWKILYNGPCERKQLKHELCFKSNKTGEVQLITYHDELRKIALDYENGMY